MISKEAIKNYENTRQFRRFKEAQAVADYLEEAFSHALLTKDSAFDAAINTPEYRAINKSGYRAEFEAQDETSN